MLHSIFFILLVPTYLSYLFLLYPTYYLFFALIVHFLPVKCRRCIEASMKPRNVIDVSDKEAEISVICCRISAKILLPSRNHAGKYSYASMCRIREGVNGGQWHEQGSIRSTGSNISPTGVAGGTWTGLNPSWRTLNVVNRVSHQTSSTRLFV